MQRKASTPALHLSQPNRHPAPAEDLNDDLFAPMSEEEVDYYLERFEEESFMRSCAAEHSCAHLSGRSAA